MHLYTTYHRLAMALIAAILLSLGMTDVSAAEHVELGCELTQSTDALPSDEPTSTIEQWHSSTPILPSEVSHSGHIVAPVRTVARTSRSSDSLLRLSMAVRSIDATTTTNRYGLYNHKILFVSHSRFYYLNCLSRLRI